MYHQTNPPCSVVCKRQGGSGRKRATVSHASSDSAPPPSLQNYPDMNGNYLNKICTNTSSPPLLLNFCSHPFPGKDKNKCINFSLSVSVSNKLKANGAMDKKIWLAKLARLMRMTKSLACTDVSAFATSFPGDVGGLGTRLVVYQLNS